MTLLSPNGYGFEEIFSDPQLTGNPLPTEISFTISQSPDKAIIGKNCFFHMRVSIIRINGATGTNTINGPLSPIINAGTRAIPTNISTPYLTQNPCMAFWSNLSCTVGSTVSTTS